MGNRTVGCITIGYVMTPEGDIITELDVEGDIPFVTQIGLLEMAKDTLFREAGNA